MKLQLKPDITTSQWTVTKVSLKANCCYSGIGVFRSYKVFSVQFKDLTGITSVFK